MYRDFFIYSSVAEHLGCFHVLVIIKWRSEVDQLCPTLCEPMDCSLPGCSAHGIFQAMVLEWVAISFSRRSSWPRDQTRVSSIVGRCFTVWATKSVIINSAAMNTGVHVSFWIMSRYMPRSAIAGLYGSSIFSLVRNLCTVLYSGWTNLHSHQWERVPFPPHLFIVCRFLMMAILTGFTVVFICISLIFSHVEHLFLYFLAICLSSLEKRLFKSSAQFVIGLFVDTELHELCILEINPCWLHHLQIFSPILRVVFLFCLWFPLLSKSF